MCGPTVLGLLIEISRSSEKWRNESNLVMIFLFPLMSFPPKSKQVETKTCSTLALSDWVTSYCSRNEWISHSLHSRGLGLTHDNSAKKSCCACCSCCCWLFCGLLQKIHVFHWSHATVSTLICCYCIDYLLIHLIGSCHFPKRRLVISFWKQNYSSWHV